MCVCVEQKTLHFITSGSILTVRSLGFTDNCAVRCADRVSSFKVLTLKCINLIHNTYTSSQPAAKVLKLQIVSGVGWTDAGGG